MRLHTSISDDEKAACTAYIDKVLDWYSTRNHYLAFDEDRAMCMYRGNANPRSLNRCSVGLNIPNRLYNPEMEMKTFSAVLINNPELQKFFAGVPVEWLDELQIIHDKCAMAEYIGKDERRDAFVSYLRSIREQPQNLCSWDCEV